jgi:hypothetical protein
VSLHWPTNAEHFVPAYQVAALPYLTSSIISAGEIQVHQFPLVTKFINVANKGTSLGDKICLAFTERGLNPSVGNFITLEQGETVHHDVRSSMLFISCSAGTLVDYQLFCGLTTIPIKNFAVLTGSNGHPGVG